MRKSKILKYTVIYNEENDGGFTVIVPSLPGCVTYGKSLGEAKAMVTDAIKLYLESLQEHKERIPSDNNSYISSVNLVLPQVHA